MSDLKTSVISATSLSFALKIGLIPVLLWISACTSKTTDHQPPVSASESPGQSGNTEESGNTKIETSVLLTEAQYKIAGIGLGNISQRSLSNVLKVNGVMDAPPQNLVSVSAPLGGFVISTDMLQGMRIKKGQVMAVMEHPDYVQLQQDFLDKKSQLQYLELDFKRQEELNKENVAADKIFEQAQAAYFSMKAQVKGLKEKLAMININSDQLTEENLSRRISIYAPQSGFVSEVHVNLGKYVNPTDMMFEIVNTEHLHAELTVFEKDVVKIKIGQKISFTLPNENDHERQASIFLIGRKIDADRSVRVHAHLENEDTDLLPGMFINASIELGENKTSAIPEAAVLRYESKNYIFVFKGKDEAGFHFEMTEVEKGVSENGFTEISFPNTVKSKGENLEIVTEGAFSLLAKMKNTEEE